MLLLHLSVQFLETTQMTSEPRIFIIEEILKTLMIQLLDDYSLSRNSQLGRKTSSRCNMSDTRMEPWDKYSLFPAPSNLTSLSCCSPNITPQPEKNRILVTNSTASLSFRQITSLYKPKEIAKKVLTCISKFLDSTTLTFSLLNGIKPLSSRGIQTNDNSLWPVSPSE